MWICLGSDAVSKGSHAMSYIHFWFWHELLKVFKKITTEPECFLGIIGGDHQLVDHAFKIEMQILLLVSHPITIYRCPKLKIQLSIERLVLSLDRGLSPTITGSLPTGSQICIINQV